MKKIYLLSAAVLSLLAAASCTKEESSPEFVTRTVISASLPSTRTALGDKDGDAWPNYWKAGDKISVNGVSSAALEAEADGKSSASFSFDEVIGTPYFAAYPASAVSEYGNGSATLTLPASQNYVASSYDPSAFLMVGTSSDGGSVALSPLVSVFHLSLTGEASISKVKLTGAAEATLSGSFTTDFDTFSPNESSSNVVELSAATPVELPADFFICVPAGLVGSLNVEVFDSEGGAMLKTATIKSALAAGQVYSPATIPYSSTNAFTIRAEGITSSTAVICWDESTEPAYTINVYSDAGCSLLVDSYEIGAESTCWGGVSPRFCISGLASGTTYYVKVDNETNGTFSNILPVTTAAFTIVQVSSTPAAVGDVILAEDFSEFRWDCDMIGVGAGWFPTSAAQGASFSTLDIGSLQAAATSNEKQISAQSGPLAASRLVHWAQGANPHMYVHPGYIKLVGQKKVTHIVTPALDNIPDGKIATVEVEVTASAYYSESSSSFCTTNAVVAVQTSDLNELTAEETNTNTLDLETNIQNITLLEESAWHTYKVTLADVVKGDRIAFGADASVVENAARMNISDIKITIKALEDPSLTASLKSVSSSSATFTWTYGGDAADDIAKPYTASLYSDSACSNLVVSHHFDAAAACWSSKSPCFSFGGLAPSTDYWLVVEDTGNGIVADAVKATTEAFTVVDATTVTNAAVGDVILAEDFSEIGWGPDILGVAAGFEPSPKAVCAPSGASPVGSFVKYDSTADRFFGSGVDLGTSRLSKGWGFFGNSSVYLDNGYTRVGASGGRTHIVTPALSGIPAGKVATLDVTVTATKYDSSIDISVFAEKGLTMNTQTTTSEADYRKYTGASLDASKGRSFGITTKGDWQTKTARISNVDSECQLLIGSLENYTDPSDNKKKNRFYISDVTVTIVSLKDPGSIDVEKDIQDFATFKSFLEACEPGKTVKGNVVADISLTSEQVAEIDALYPVAEFEGILNGNNHTITGLTKPLFNKFNGTASNLTLNSTLNITEAMRNVGIFAQSATDATLTGCVSSGSITHASATSVNGDLIIGGLIGSISGCTLTACHNLANVTNTTTATEYVRMGGLIGVADGANTLTGTATEFNYNKSVILENSASSKVAVGGICGYTSSAPSDFAYARNQIQDGDDVDDVVIKDNTRDKVYVGGIIGMSANTSSFDYASNVDADVCVYDLTMSATGQVFAGGIIGGWSASGEQTITGCSNSGWVYTKRHSDSNKYYDDISVGETPTPLWSLFGGIAGMGSTGTSEGLNGGFNTITGKTFTNCTMSGRVLIYCKVRCCIGGVVAYTENDPVGCECTNNIRLYKSGGIGTVGSNYHRQIVGGVVGYFNGSSATNLKYDGTLNSNASSPFAYTSGIIGYLDTSEVELNNCRIGGSVRAAGSGQGRNAVMCHNNTNTVSVTFTNCLIKKGTVSYATGSKVTIDADSDVTAGQCMGVSDTGYTIVGDVLPTVADSI